MKTSRAHAKRARHRTAANAEKVSPASRSIPASTSRHALELLRRYESRHVTFQTPDGHWPIVWERARGCHVWDVDGRRYLDLTAAFGVAAAGHANPAVVRAGQRQMERLLHAMGDVHPPAVKAQLARALSLVTFERWTAGRSSNSGKVVLANSGFEAVEIALKTARLATGRPGVIAFIGGYHGLGYGALNVTHREFFRSAFRDQLREFAEFVPYPTNATSLQACERRLRDLLKHGTFGAILAEPVQARGGIVVPADDFLPTLRALCDAHNALLILDEIYTGFGRTGRWFGCEHSRVVPDVICLGKALTGGFPLSACVGRADVMEAWPESRGEALHTSTFLGHPVGCAMALAQMEQLRKGNLPARAEHLGTLLIDELRAAAERMTGRYSLEVRGLGLMVGLAVANSRGQPATNAVVQLVQNVLRRGYVFLPEGEHSNVLAWTPPLTINEVQLRASVRAAAEELEKLP